MSYSPHTPEQQILEQSVFRYHHPQSKPGCGDGSSVSPRHHTNCVTTQKPSKRLSRRQIDMSQVASGAAGTPVIFHAVMPPSAGAASASGATVPQPPPSVSDNVTSLRKLEDYIDRGVDRVLRRLEDAESRLVTTMKVVGCGGASSPSSSAVPPPPPPPPPQIVSSVSVVNGSAQTEDCSVRHAWTQTRSVVTTSHQTTTAPNNNNNSNASSDAVCDQKAILLELLHLAIRIQRFYC